VAKVISDKVFTINSEQRKALRGSFQITLITLYTIGNEICQENQFFRYFKTLDLETAQKNIGCRPKTQTGPAKRNDLKTIEAHQFYRTNQSTIYKIITQSIQDNGKKLHNNERHPPLYFRR
jgi:hypothetical protein